MPGTLVVTCTRCAARIKVPTQILGQTRKCPGCKTPLLIRRDPLEDSGPLLIGDEAPAGSLAAHTPSAGKKVILLVDDDRELNDGLRFLLEKDGHQVIQAFDGVQAKEMVHEHQPDLMVLDMMMPRTGGYAVLEHLHKQPDPVPVIMMTGKDGAQHKLYAEYLGVVDYLNKPFPIERFLASVERGLGPKQNERSVTGS